MKVRHQWRIPVAVLWLTAIISGCANSHTSPNGSMKPRQVYRTDVAVSVPLPTLANRLAFTREGTLFVTHPDDTDARTVPLAFDVSGGATWSPDGAYLAVAGETGGGTDIYILPLDPQGTPLDCYNITQSPNTRESSPVWSPDGHNLAYSAVKSDNWGIFVMELGLFGTYREPMIFDDRRASPQAQSLRFKGNPVWSPDGKWLSYTTNAGGRWQIATIVPHEPETVSQPGTEIPVTGTAYPSSAVDPSWSPDGSRLVFSANPRGNWDLFVVDAGGTSLLSLTTHSADDWHPVWSPDGTWIAFTSNRSGNSDIYLITADGAFLAQLTATPSSEDFATWLPRQLPEQTITP